MRFEIPFKEKYSRKDSELIFYLHWKEPLKKNKKTLYFIFPFLTVGGLIVYGDDNIGFLFIAIGFYYLFNYINFLNRYKINRKVYFGTVEKHIAEYLSHDQTIVWKFEEELFCYSDFKYDLKINWTAFTTFKILDDCVLLELRDNIIGNFLLSKEEIGIENFDNIIHFLETRIKNQ